MSENSEESATPPLNRAEFNDYPILHAHKRSPRDLRVLAERLRALRDGFYQVKSSQFPRTVERLRFLSDVVEPFVAGRLDELPFETAAKRRLHSFTSTRKWISFQMRFPGAGLVDEATMVARVLERDAPAFRKVTQTLGTDWDALAIAEQGVFGT